MDKRTGIILGAIAALVVIILIVIVAAGGGDDDKDDISTANTSTTVVTTTDTGAVDSGGGGGSSGGGGGGQQTTNEQPYFQPDYSIEEDGCENGKPLVRVDLHAYDPDGPEEEEVLEVQFVWGDGNQTNIPGSQGSNNAFSSTHEYDPSYIGQSVHVVVRAVDGDGGSAQFEGDVTLPASC